ncbi:MAG: UPF0149 family protein [Gammaproteobacteria bacterium]|uniref:UPF0149 family protein n=1 Tax=Candidatus Thiopontia autotrophica TaxID=2841688 RepID=A0A8J6NYB1_9GAMM|nr:UPF0149 family protein [Candidatus Thiopontia autotrophica]MBL6969366.1 UPF0149 family protein [Gammaproteobacteria bacterium]
MEKIQYNDVSDALRRLSLAMDGAELHGSFCGRLMSGHAEDEIGWLKEVVGERDEANLQAREDVAMIARMVADVAQQLNGDELQFELFLPEDEPLDVRTEALAAWCEGFLYGYGIASASEDFQESEVQQEFLKDLMEISRASFIEGEDDHGDEEDEMDFLQVVEHVRIGTMLLYEGSNSVKSPIGSLPLNETIH